MFPLAENITRRLKKLVQLISRIEGQFDFESITKPSEPTGFSAEEKQAIVDTIGDFGVPVLVEDVNKADFSAFRNKVLQLTGKSLVQSD